MKKRTLIGLLAVLPLALLGACGGNSGNDATVRLVNASPGYTSLDLYVDDSKVASSVTFGAVSDSASAKNGTVTTALTAADSTTDLLTQSRSLSSGKKYAVVAYGWEGALKSVVMSEDETEADSDKTNVSVLNTSVDAGSLDVYLTGENDDLVSATPVRTAVAGGSRSSFSAVTSGTYRLRVTGTGDYTDLRLDVSNVTISSKGVVTFIITPTTGGVLVNSLMFTQGGAMAQQLGTKARARVMAAVDGGAAVTLYADTFRLANASKSPAIQSYTLINAGLVTVNTSIDGNSLGSQQVNVAVGADLTLLVSGTSAGTATMTPITDDNRLPTVSTKYKIRLLHASPLLAADALTLSVDLSDVIGNQGYPAASAYETITANSSSDISVTDFSANTTFGELTDQAMVGNSVYTMFVYDTSAGVTTAKLLKER